MCGHRVGRKTRFVQDDHRSAGAGEGDRGGGTRAASPDNDYVDGFGRTRGHRHGLLRFQGWRISKFRVTHSIVLTPWVHGLPPSERSLSLKSGMPRVPKSRCLVPWPNVGIHFSCHVAVFRWVIQADAMSWSPRTSRPSGHCRGSASAAIIRSAAARKPVALRVIRFESFSCGEGAISPCCCHH